jgi:hypothetical protein
MTVEQILRAVREETIHSTGFMTLSEAFWAARVAHLHYMIDRVKGELWLYPE